MSRYTELDPERVSKAAREALTRPSDYAAWDERWYVTHGCVGSWAERGDDILAESNYHAALARLQAAVAHDETGASEERGDDVEDTTASHWLVGSLRELFVRVYVELPEGEWGWQPEVTDLAAYTPAFLEAVRIADDLADYAILDESDYSERECEAWFDLFGQALDDVERDLRDLDDDVDRACIRARTAGDSWERMPEVGHPDELDWEAVADGYRAYRNDYYEWQAQRWLPVVVQAAPVNQLELELTVA